MAEPSHQRGNRLARLARLVPTALRNAPVRVRVAAPLAVAATVGVVGVGTVVATPGADGPPTDVSAVASLDLDALLSERAEAGTSRSDDRADAAAADEAWAAWSTESTALAQQQAEAAAQQRALAQQQAEQAAQAAQAETAAAVAAADTSRWAGTDLDLHTTSEADAEVVGLLEEGTEVLVTGRAAGGREEIVWEEQSRWVTAGYLEDEEPSAAATLGGECTTSSAPSGVTANITALHGAVCAAFPEITNYGGTRTDGDHGRGLALDIMVRGARGWEIAEFIRANYTEWDVNYVIYEQKIWSVDRSSEGWRPMENRGSDTANHYDHVHVSVY
ncbi:hypothetical protein RDV89_19325 [Nocardioides zeae]|uniref:ARB-07466-like C-terminal domain-containing protein n=1 Tax=Nocardioides imazamoxiresistens TaxID=3231893 RepID=A0ABU3Q160_9ACTN|nr:hypothetical protein [Nocardioides zeae]MDT9595248.1 hypothetical protein [Nocardioides zeae]